MIVMRLDGELDHYDVTSNVLCSFLSIIRFETMIIIRPDDVGKENTMLDDSLYSLISVLMHYLKTNHCFGCRRLPFTGKRLQKGLS